MTDLGVLDPGTFGSTAVGVSAAGDVVVGNSTSARSRTGLEPFRWTVARGIERLSGELPAGLDGAEARSISADGSVVVGIGWVTSPRNVTPRRSLPIHWTAASGWRVLGGFEPTASEGSANAVSGDGMVTVGVVSVPRWGDAVSWTAGAGMRLFSAPREWEDACQGAVPMAVSANGRFVAGSVIIDNREYACRWTDGQEPMFLNESPPAFVWGSASGISDDGNLIVGGVLGFGAYIWEPRTGMRSLWERLVELGVDPASQAWLTLGPQAVSGNGRFLCGQGFRGRSDQAFLIDLAPELKFLRVRGGLRLTWPPGFTLERCSSSLAGASWERMPEARSPHVVSEDNLPHYFQITATQ